MAGQKFSDVVINERTFRVYKFGARDGSYIIIKMSGLLSEMFRGVDFSKIKDAKDPSEVDLKGFDIAGMISRLSNISEKDFSYLQEKCLNVCSEKLKSGFVPVLNDNGSFGVIDLEDDTITVMALTAHALIFNLMGFFQGSVLSGVMSGLLTTPQ